MQGLLRLGLPHHVKREVTGAGARESFHRRKKSWLSRIGELQSFLKTVGRTMPAQTAQQTNNLSDCESALTRLRDLVNQHVSDPDTDYIARVFASPHVVNIPFSPRLYKQIVEMGLESRKPFGGKNSTSDATILLSIVLWARSRKRQKIVFHTLNKEDFSDPDDRSRPHSDLSTFFAPHTNISYSEGMRGITAIAESLDAKKNLGSPIVWGHCLLCDEPTGFESISCISCHGAPKYWPDEESYALTPRGEGYLIDSLDMHGGWSRAECEQCHKKTFEVELESLCGYHRHVMSRD